MTKYEVTIIDKDEVEILGPIAFEFPDVWIALESVLANYRGYKGAESVLVQKHIPEFKETLNAE